MEKETLYGNKMKNKTVEEIAKEYHELYDSFIQVVKERDASITHIDRLETQLRANGLESAKLTGPTSLEALIANKKKEEEAFKSNPDLNPLGDTVKAQEAVIKKLREECTRLKAGYEEMRGRVRIVEQGGNTPNHCEVDSRHRRF